MTDAADIEIACGVSARDRRAILNLRANHEMWALAAYVERPQIEVEAVIRTFEDGRLPMPSEDDVLAEEAKAAKRRKAA